MRGRIRRSHYRVFRQSSTSRIRIRETGEFGERGTVVIRPAAAVPVEKYSKERVAEFLLTNAVDADDYENVRKEVREMGVDPDSVPSRRPESAKNP